MTTTPDAKPIDDKPHLTIAALGQMGQYAFRLARAGRIQDALEQIGAIERLIASYRGQMGGGVPDTLGAWLYQRFVKTADAPPWDALTDEGRAYWEHQARAVRRAVARGGFKDRGGE